MFDLRKVPTATTLLVPPTMTAQTCSRVATGVSPRPRISIHVVPTRPTVGAAAPQQFSMLTSLRSTTDWYT